MRQGIAGLIGVQPDMTLVAEAENGCEAIPQFRAHRPDVTLRYMTRAQARLDLIDWIEGFYNANRLHSSINYLSPTSFEKELKAA